MRATDLSHRPVIQGLLEATGRADTEPATTEAGSPAAVASAEPPLTSAQLEETLTHDLDELDDLVDNRVWDAGADLEPVPDEPPDGTPLPFTPPVPAMHEVEPLPDLDDDRARGSQRRLSRRRPWMLAAGLVLLIMVVVVAGGDEPSESASPPAEHTAATARLSVPTATRAGGRRRETETAPRSRAHQPRRRPTTAPQSVPRTSTSPSPASASGAIRNPPAPRSPWSEEFFRP